MIARAADLKGVNGSSFTDHKYISSDYLQEVYAVYNAGIISGTPEGEFNPQDSATRAHASVMIVNLTEYLKGEKETAYTPLREQLGIWSVDEFWNEMKANNEPKHFRSIEGFRAFMDRAKYFTDVENAYIYPVFEQLMSDLAWYAKENDDYVEYRFVEGFGLYVEYFATEDTEDLPILTVWFIPKADTWQAKKSDIEVEYGFKVHRLYSTIESDNGVNGKYWERVVENEHALPEFVKVIEIAADRMYKSEGQAVADLVVSEYKRIAFSFDNVVEERVIEFGNGPHYLDSNKEVGSTGFSSVNLWSNHESVIGVK